jgi:hypothetical protein
LANQSGFRQVNANVRPLFAVLLISRSIAIDYLLKLSRNRNVAVLYIYFSEIDLHRPTPSPIFRNLLKQVVGQLDPVPASVSQMYETFSATASNPDLVTWSQTLKECLMRFEAAYILFDAIDECGDQQPRIISRVIRELLRVSSVKLLLTSRDPEPQGLPSPPELAHLTVKASDHDIRTFLTANLDTDVNLSQDLKNEIIEAISKNADGM